jgi:hypothetical protein
MEQYGVETILTQVKQIFTEVEQIFGKKIIEENKYSMRLNKYVNIKICFNTYNIKIKN